MPSIPPDRDVDVDLLIESMKRVFREIYAQEAEQVERREHVFEQHVKQAEAAIKQVEEREKEMFMRDKQNAMSMTLAMQFYLGYFDQQRKEVD